VCGLAGRDDVEQGWRAFTVIKPCILGMPSRGSKIEGTKIVKGFDEGAIAKFSVIALDWQGCQKQALKPT
jgi:hypothetical protein